MKKCFKFTKVMLAVIFMSFAMSASAATNCSKVVDVMCRAFQNMSVDVNKCKSLDELSQLNFDNCLNGINGDDLPDSCLQYKLTKADKTKLKGSIDSFSDNLVNKMYDLAGGVISKDYIRSEMNNEMGKFKQAVDNAVTFEDFVNSVSN